MRKVNQLILFMLLSFTSLAGTNEDQISVPNIYKVICTNSIHWGVNVHDGGNDPQNLANKLEYRNLKYTRMDLYGNDSTYLKKFRKAVKIMNVKNIKTEAVVFTIFSSYQARTNDYSADLAEVEQISYTTTKTQIISTKDIISDYELQNEIPLYPNIKVLGSTGQNAIDFDVPAGRLQAAVLRGMSRAIDDVRKTFNLPLRIILGTVDRQFGFLTYMQQQGVLFDVVGYHIYPWNKHPPLDQDLYFGEGGALGQLAKFNKPIHINEFNAGEIYSGGKAYPKEPDYENQAGKPVTEEGFKSLYKHMNEIVNQKGANIESVYFYEIADEPQKPIPENRFGLYFDVNLEKPKISLYIATAFAGGTLSTAEKDSLIKRNFTYIIPVTNITNQQFDSDNSIKIYPNPVRTNLKVQSNVKFNSIHSYDNLGYKVLASNSEVNITNSELILTSLAQGIYPVKVKCDKLKFLRR